MGIMSRTKRLLIFLGAVFVTLGAVLFFAPPNARNSSYVQTSFDGNNSELTIQAWSDASYTFSSSKWMFLYEPSFGSSHEEDLSFPFPFFPINPDEAERLGGQPVLTIACSTLGDSQMEGSLLIATVGALYSWNRLELRVSEANPTFVVLSFIPLP